MSEQGDKFIIKKGKKHYVESHDLPGRYDQQIGIADRGNIFGNLGILEMINKWREKRRVEKFEKALQEIVIKVNTIPRGFGNLPENKRISLNGYYNYKHPDLIGKEQTVMAETLGTGNDWETNARLYGEAMQLIEDLFYDCRHLYVDNPELKAKAAEVRSNLELREECENYLRQVSYDPQIVELSAYLDDQFGLRRDWRYKEMTKSGIAPVLSEAEKDLELAPEDVEKLKVYLAKKRLFLVPRHEVYTGKIEAVRPFSGRKLLEFIKKYEGDESEVGQESDSQRVERILKAREARETAAQKSQREFLLKKKREIEKKLERDGR